MGLRGPGANRLKRAREALPAKPRRLPWTRKGLSRVERIIAFLEFLPITKGKLVGQKMKLLPGQRKFIEDVYGRPDDDRVRIAVKSEPRGQGKTGLSAGLALCHLLGPESEPRGEVYSAAINSLQAGVMFNEMEAIILEVPEFAGIVNTQRHHKKIEVMEGEARGSLYEALSADARRAHGLAPSLWIYDELAQSPDRQLLDNLTTGMGKRKRSLGIVISTQAPTDDHPLSLLIDDGLSGADPSIVVHLLSAPQDADPFTIETIRSVNPALGVFLDESDLVAEAERARRIPAFEPAFRNLRLNQRVDAREEDRLLTAGVWKLGNAPVDRAALKGRTCYAGLDLSGTKDLTALVLVVPDDAPRPSFSVLPFFWTPEDQLPLRTVSEQERFRQWIRLGHMEVIPGPVICFDFVAARLASLSREFDIQVVAYDRYRIEDFKKDLGTVDPNFPVEMEPFGQGPVSMGPAIEWFAELALTGRLRHGGHPVLNAAVAGAITKSDAAGNLSIHKGKSNRGPVRVDGAVALVMALTMAKRFEGAPKIDVDDFLANMVVA